MQILPWMPNIFPLQIQTSCSESNNSAKMSATTVNKGKRKKLIDIEKFGGTPPYFVGHPVPGLSCGRVPFVTVSNEHSVKSVWIFSESQKLGRAIHGPIPVSGETLDKLSGPLVHTDFPWKQGTKGLVHTDFPWNSYGPMAPKSLWKFWSKLASVHRVLLWEIRSGRSRCAWDSPLNCPGILPRHANHQIPLCVWFVYQLFLLPIPLQE